jgi:hypothetical protein
MGFIQAIFFIILTLFLLNSCEGTNTDFLVRLSGTGEITIYQEYCLPKDSTRGDIFNCEAGRLFPRAKSFRVDYANQRVVEIDFPTTRYDDCKVYNSKNWYCNYKDGDFAITTYMKNGEYGEYFPNDKTNSNLISDLQIPLIRYRYLQIKRFF